MYGSMWASNTKNVLAYVPFSIWSNTGDDELNLPLSSDCLSQQIQITVQLKPAYVPSPSPGAVPNAGFFHLAYGASAPATLPPTGFDTAYFQVQQIQMMDRSMALANRVDLSKEMYSLPLAGGFDQYEQTFQIKSADATTNTAQAVVLTGFRAGMVKSIQFYLQPNFIANYAAATYDNAANPLLFSAPQQLQVLYAGLVYSNFNNGSSQIWSLLNGTAPDAVNQNVIASSGNNWIASTSNPQLSQWTNAKFSQPTGSDFSADIHVAGLEITNGIVNVNIIPPPMAGVPAGVDNAWTLHVIYNYAVTVGFSRGTADLIF